MIPAGRVTEFLRRWGRIDRTALTAWHQHTQQQIDFSAFIKVTILRI